MADPTRADEPVDAGGADAGAQVLLGLLRSGGNLPSLLALLAQAPMTVEQRTIIELLGELDAGSDGSGDDDEQAPVGRPARPARDAAMDVSYYAPPESEPNSPSPPIDARALGLIRKELADLREVNDTLAAALGACRACWGGEGRCPICGGDGQAGASPPDAKLFEALVVPAVRRMRSHAHRSRTTEASP